MHSIWCCCSGKQNFAQWKEALLLDTHLTSVEPTLTSQRVVDGSGYATETTS